MEDCESCPHFVPPLPVEAVPTWELWIFANHHCRDGVSGDLRYGEVRQRALDTSLTLTDVERALSLDVWLQAQLKDKGEDTSGQQPD